MHPNQIKRNIREALGTAERMLFVFVQDRNVQGAAHAVAALQLMHGAPVRLAKPSPSADERRFLSSVVRAAAEELSKNWDPVSSLLVRNLPGASPEMRRITLAIYCLQELRGLWDATYGRVAPGELIPSRGYWYPTEREAFAEKTTETGRDGTTAIVMTLPERIFELAESAAPSNEEAPN